MKTYEIIQLVEMTIRHKVRAKTADEANHIATIRTLKAMQAITSSRKDVSFGDVQADYVPAREDQPEES